MRVEVVPHDPRWADQFVAVRHESPLIQRILARAGFTASERDAIDAVNRGTDERPRG